MILQFLFQIILLSWLMMTLAQAQLSVNCSSQCGGVEIPYPFGIEPGCSVDDWFAVDCTSSKPFLRSINLELLEISIPTNTMQVNYSIYNSCQNESTSQFVNLDTTPFEFSDSSSNRFTAVSCSKLAKISTNQSVISGCSSICKENATNIGVDISCQSGINCCQTTIGSLKNFNVSVEPTQSSISNGEIQQPPQDCDFAFLVDQNWFVNDLTNLQDLRNMTRVPVRISWAIFISSLNQLAAWNSSTNSTSNSSCISDSSVVRCNCLGNFTGNPYLSHGCHGKFLMPDQTSWFYK